MMVSNMQDSTPAAPLSYADRVKKSQRKDSSSTGSAPRPQARGQPSASSSTTPSAPKVAKPAALELSQSQGAGPVADLSVSSSPNAARVAPGAKPTNGEIIPSTSGLQTPDPYTPAMKKTPATPPAVNVWSLRKEQMAKAQSQQAPRASDSSAEVKTASGNVPPLAPAASSSTSQVPTTFSVPPNDADKSANESTINRGTPGTGLPTEDDEDAWVVRPNRAPTAVRLPALDASSWPEVGKGSAGDAPSSAPAGSSGGEAEDRVRKEAQSSGPKRGEKTKWVPIPAEELRAAADAQRSARSSQSRSQSQQRVHSRGQSSATATGGRSNNGSQERSKTHSSAVRERPSAPQSEIHSRTGSVQSSPRHPATRLRRMPDEASGSTSRRSSRATSPRPYPHIAGPRPVEFSHGPVPQLDAMNGVGYYPALPHTHVPSPYSVTPPYPPPPGAIPIAYNPAYHYPAYPYGGPAGQSYPMFWPAMNQDPRHPYAVSSQSQSPATHPSSLTRSDDASPPTSVGPSPAEEHTESTVMPANAGTANATNDAQESTAERKSSGARQRILSFGSIRADGEIVGGEAGAGEVKDAEKSAHQASSLGLDVGSISISDNVDVTPRNGERSTFKLNAEVPAFSIELARGDPGPSSKKPQVAASSSHEPQTTGVSTSTSAVINGDEKGPHASTSEPTWEFGTTREEPRATEASSASEAAARTEPGITEGATNKSDLATPDSIPLRVRLSPLGVNAEGLPPTPIPPSAGPALYANNNPLAFEHTSKEDEWRVRDFGYGFGRPRPDGTYAPREERPPKDRSYYGGGGRGAPRSYEPDGYRRGFGGRRGRGGPRGFGRGRRGDYRGSFSRFPPRDAEYDVEEAYMYGPPEAGVYFVPPPPPPNYVLHGFDPSFVYPGAYPMPPLSVAQSSAPVPAPLTKLSFSLDPTRYYLLGQLEYYLSEDNMAQDLYLRKQMDQYGWISCHLLATFPRVKTWTNDAQVVREVVSLSSLVEVKGDFVRPHKWSRYVLPNAKPSVVEGSVLPPADAPSVDVEQLLLQNPPSQKSSLEPSGAAVPPQSLSQQAVEQAHVPSVANHADVSAADGEQEYEEQEDEEDEEDDVVFVLGQDANRSWTPERKIET